MKAHLRGLFDHYRAHHEMDRPLLQWIGVVGCIAFPLFYTLRVAAGAAGFNDLPLRLIAAVLCLALALRSRWPTRLQRHYIAYSYLVVFYCLAFLLSFTMLKNNAATPYVINMVVGAMLITLLVDWRNTIVMLLSGYVLAVIAYLSTESAPVIPREFIFASAGSLLIVTTGALSHQGQKRVEIQRMRNLYAALAGSIAHEMRNPLAQVRHALDSIASTLAPDHPSQDVRIRDSQIAAMLATVQQGRQAVSRGQQAIELTLQQLKTRNAADRHRMPIVSAAQCVRHALEAFAYDDEGQRSRVRLLEISDFQFNGDQVAIELVLFNLLKNALYYVPIRPDMQVTVTVGADSAPCIVVRDTGPGIAPELIARLFQEFQTAGKVQGTGLGLSFCRRVMKELGGEISCRSQVGHFTEFTLTFPLLQPGAGTFPAPSAGPLAHAPLQLRGRTVLVVDDQALNRAIARSMGRDLGLEVLEADHGQRALDLLRSGCRAEVVLMDINMPGLNGIETTRAIRALPGPVGTVPIVAVTANTAPEILQAARSAGMNAVLGKPIDSELLRLTLCDVLQHAQAAQLLLPQEQQRAAGPDLLDHDRLQRLQRLGVLKELVPMGLRDLRELTRELRGCLAARPPEDVRRPLHTLIGVSGELGAQHLHLLARSLYDLLGQGNLSEGSAWLLDLEAALKATEIALLQDYNVRAGGDTQLAIGSKQRQ